MSTIVQAGMQAGDDTTRERRRRRLFALSLPFLFVGLAELGLRIIDWSYPQIELPVVIWNPREDAEMLEENTLHEFSSELLWAPRGGAPIPWAEGELVSPAGFRGADPDPGARLRVLVLGDSSTFGYGVRDAETYAARLEARLESELGLPDADVQVLNGGIVGSTIVQGLARYRQVSERWVPHFVVEAFGAVNEHYPSKGIADREKIGKSRRWASYRESQEGWLASLARRLRQRARVVHAAAFVADQSKGGRVAILEERGREGSAVHWSAKPYLENPDYARRVTPEDFAWALEALRSEVEALGGRLVLVGMPRRVETEEGLHPVLDYDRVLSDFAQRSGSVLVDLREDFRQSGSSEDELFLDRDHPTPEGHARMAARLSEAILPLARALAIR